MHYTTTELVTNGELSLDYQHSAVPSIYFKLAALNIKLCLHVYLRYRIVFIKESR